eukprot:9262715-Pyramimonas_sp.AAC.1
MVQQTFVPGYIGSRQNRLSSDKRARVHAQGELSSSMTIVSLPLRLSEAACPPPSPDFRP